MSSPNTTPKRTPRRTSPKRTPLQERTPSQKNEVAGRLHGDSKQDLNDTNIFTTTPFPTKPQHVLLPSTIRKQRSRQNVENELPALFNSSQSDVAGPAATRQQRQDERRVRRAPNLQLKKSVTALRDMYEAQAENSRPSTAYSRPSTAAPSPALRPTTASSRIRSISSSEGFPGRSAWEMLGLPRVSAADDLSALPTLAESVGMQLDSDNSFASRMRNQPGSSSPNFRTFGTSSPALPTFHDAVTSSDLPEQTSSSQLEMTGMSSNFIQLNHSSSVMTTDPTPPLEEGNEEEGESSPNLVKLGTTSPVRSSSPAASVSSSGSRKRKRTDMEGSAYAGRTPLFFGVRRQRSHSSPSIRNIPANSDLSIRTSETRVLPSSPPEVDSALSQEEGSSSPIIRVHGGDRSSIVSAHTNLQSVLSSSPGPPIQRPIVRAPDVRQFENLALQKRTTSGQTAETTNTVPLSPVPSVTNIEVQQLSSTDLSQFQPQRSLSRLSAFTEDLDENLDDDSIRSVQAYMMRHDLNNSQVNMISDNDRHEATDELRALPRQNSSFAAALSQARSASFLGSTSSSNSLSRLESMRTSMDSRFHSMRSFNHARNNSSRSTLRPGSSGSYMSQTMVPTWARQYYSGLYRDSFQYLYQSSANLPYTITQVQPHTRPGSRSSSVPLSSSYGTFSMRSRSDMRRSLSRSLRTSLKNMIPSIPLPTSRPKLNVRDSHMTAGIGPLVSNPVRPSTDLLSRPSSAHQNRHTLRRVSAPLSAADPRYHWNGIIEETETAEEADRLQDHEFVGTPRHEQAVHVQSGHRPTRGYYAAPWRFLRTSTPHLHQDRRLHTGSSESQGFGAPYNIRYRWQPPSGRIDDVKNGQSSWSKPDLADAQVLCFMTGFVFPLSWFIAALLPLPSRPSKYIDIEKGTHISRPFTDNPNDGENGDIIARLRLEKHLQGLEEVKWQKARWWRRMNRWMSCVGLVVLIVVVVLAVIGTRDWS